jgi:hypothetical protein
LQKASSKQQGARTIVRNFEKSKELGAINKEQERTRKSKDLCKELCKEQATMSKEQGTLSELFKECEASSKERGARS